MKSSDIESRKRALEVLGQWVPREVLLRARQQAEAAARDELVRAYLLRHVGWIVVALLGSVAGAMAAMLWLVDFAAAVGNRPLLVTLFVLVFMPIALGPALALLLYLEKRALRERKPVPDCAGRAGNF